MAVDTGSLAAELGSVCSSWRELPPGQDADLAVDELLPPLWCEPTTPDELAQVVGLANRVGAAVIPRGGGSRMALGMPPRAADLLLSTRGLNRIIEYEPADLTVTVEAGLGFAELQERLGAEGQFLALDPPSPVRATIGGVVASNASGPLRLQYGSARDLVIGTRVANADGVLTKAGGRVVKNVAGYDLNKLYTGSLGTLGVIVELSFKLHPLPQSRGMVLATFSSLDEAAALVQRVVRSPLGPSAIEILDAEAARSCDPGITVPEQGCALLVLVGGFEKAVARVTKDIAGFCRESGSGEPGPYDEQLWSAVRELADASDAAQPLLKLAVPPARSVEAFARLRSLGEEAGLRITILAHAGIGLVYGRFDRSEWATDGVERLAGLVREARAFAVDHEGSLVVEAAPIALKRLVDSWGEIGPALDLMRALKHQLDPTGTLNPGRYVGGI